MKTKEKTENKKTGKRKRGKKLLKFLLGLFILLIALVVIMSVMTFVGNKASFKKLSSFETINYENQLVPEKDEDGNFSFVTDREFKIVQLTDVHIGAGFMSLRKDASALNAVAAMLTQEKPDLVIVTGDIAYPVPFQSGTINNKTSAALFAGLMERLGVYWTLSFGNHDTELYSLYDREEIADFYMSGDYPHCIFTKGPEEVSGVGNQIINIRNSLDIITQSVFVLDSHAYTDGDYLGIRWKYDNIHDDQVEWYKSSLEALCERNSDAYKKTGENEKELKSLIFFHIPLVEMREAWNEFADNGYADTENVRLNYGFAGGQGKIVFCGKHEDSLFETAQELGSTQAMFFGHDHRNNISFNYKGIDLAYAMSIDYLAIPGIGKIGRQRGCTVINVNPDGSYESHNENYYQDKYASVFEKEDIEMQDITYPYSEK